MSDADVQAIAKAIRDRLRADTVDVDRKAESAARAVLAVLPTLGYVPREDLDTLRAAWNAHMEQCSGLPNAPTWEQLEKWRNAPSDTAGGG